MSKKYTRIGYDKLFNGFSSGRHNLYVVLDEAGLISKQAWTGMILGVNQLINCNIASDYWVEFTNGWKANLDPTGPLGGKFNFYKTLSAAHKRSYNLLFGEATDRGFSSDNYVIKSYGDKVDPYYDLINHVEYMENDDFWLPPLAVDEETNVSKIDAFFQGEDIIMSEGTWYDSVDSYAKKIEVDPDDLRKMLDNPDKDENYIRKWLDDNLPHKKSPPEEQEWKEFLKFPGYLPEPVKAVPSDWQHDVVVLRSEAGNLNYISPKWDGIRIQTGFDSVVNVPCTEFGVSDTIKQPEMDSVFSTKQLQNRSKELKSSIPIEDDSNYLRLESTTKEISLPIIE